MRRSWGYKVGFLPGQDHLQTHLEKRNCNPDFHKENPDPGKIQKDSLLSLWKVIQLLSWLGRARYTSFICLTFLFLEFGKGYFGPYEPY